MIERLFLCFGAMVILSGCMTPEERLAVRMKNRGALIAEYWANSAQADYDWIMREEGKIHNPYCEWSNRDESWLKSWAGSRLKLSQEDYLRGCSLIETFASKYMPNRYASYGKIRDKIQEVQQVFNEEFPDPEKMKESNPKWSVYCAALKSFINVRMMYFKAHDEICHFYALYRAGIVTAEELAVSDRCELNMLLFEENVYQYRLTAKARDDNPKTETFLNKYMPESYSVYLKLIQEQRSAVELLAEMEKELRMMDAVRVCRGHWALFGRIRSLDDELDVFVNQVEKLKLEHTLATTDAAALAERDHTMAVRLNKLLKRSTKEKCDRAFGLIITPYDMVRVPGENYLICKRRFSKMERSMVGSGREIHSGRLIRYNPINYRKKYWHRVENEYKGYLKDSQSYAVGIRGHIYSDDILDTINDVYGGVIASPELREPSASEWVAASKVSCDKDGNHVGGCWPDALGLFGMCDHEWSESTSSRSYESHGQFVSSKEWCGGDYYDNKGGTGLRLVMDAPSGE